MITRLAYGWGGISANAALRQANVKKYNGYTENKDLDLNWYESLYRTHHPQLGRFWQLDPKPTQFESLYAAMGNNPVKNMDILGDTLWVYGNENRADLLGAIGEVFGANNFKFNDNGALLFTGDLKNFKGNSKKLLTKFLDNVVTSTNTVTFKSNDLTDDEKLNADSHGGAVTFINPKTKDARILINKDNKSRNQVWEKEYIVKVDGKEERTKNMPLKGFPEEVYVQKKDKDGNLMHAPFSSTARIFHEFGHVIYEGQRQSKVIEYENIVRKQLNLTPLRSGIDPIHN